MRPRVLSIRLTLPLRILQVDPQTGRSLQSYIRSILGGHRPTAFAPALQVRACKREEIRGWVANRFYYQANIPRKDGAILSSCPDREVRRRWVQRIIDHDGTTEGSGGIESWLRLGEAVGLTREEIEDERHLLPGVRFAVDAYVTFTRTRPWVEAVASSLTELFAPDLMADRLAAFERHYTWIDPRGLAYFRC